MSRQYLDGKELCRGMGEGAESSGGAPGSGTWRSTRRAKGAQARSRSGGGWKEPSLAGAAGTGSGEMRRGTDYANLCI